MKYMKTMAVITFIVALSGLIANITTHPEHSISSAILGAGIVFMIQLFLENQQ